MVVSLLLLNREWRMVSGGWLIDFVCFVIWIWEGLTCYLEWMSREVFALTMSPGGIPPPIVPVLSKSAFKQKRKIKTKAQHW